MIIDEVLVGRALDRIAAGLTAEAVESTYLDFKQPPRPRDRRSPDEVAGDLEKVLLDACLCFANADGGVVVLGIADRTPGEAAFVGTTADGEVLKARIYHRSQPPLLVDVHERRTRGVRLLEFHVPRGVDVHADTQGRAPHRINTDCVHINPAQVQWLREERLGFDFSALVSRKPFAAVDQGATETCRQLLRELTDRRREIAELSPRDLLAVLGAIDCGGGLTRAGEILLTAPDRPAIVYVYRDAPGRKPRLVDRLGAPLVLAYQDLLKLIAARRNLTPVNYRTDSSFRWRISRTWLSERP